MTTAPDLASVLIVGRCFLQPTRRFCGRTAALALCRQLFIGQGFARADLIASFPMNESSWFVTPPQVTDTTGNGHNGTANAGANTTVDGMFGQVGTFNGSGQYVGVGGSYNMQGARSILAWVDPQANSLSLGLPIITGGTSGSGDFFGIAGTGGENSGVLHYALYVDHWGYQAYRSTTLVTPGQWSLVAMTYDGSNTINFYINGSPAGSVTSLGLYNYDISTYSIGGSLIGGSTTVGSFSGRMHDVSIYNNALSASDINELYVTSIPEPPSGVLILLGVTLGGLILLRRQFRRGETKPTIRALAASGWSAVGSYRLFLS